RSVARSWTTSSRLGWPRRHDRPGPGPTDCRPPGRPPAEGARSPHRASRCRSGGRCPGHSPRHDVSMTYSRAAQQSIHQPEQFRGEQAKLVDWFRKPDKVLDSSNAPFHRWFPDATLNTCFNALDRHVIHGASDRTALVHDSAVTGDKRSYTYAQLLTEVAA